MYDTPIFNWVFCTKFINWRISFLKQIDFEKKKHLFFIQNFQCCDLTIINTGYFSSSLSSLLFWRFFIKLQNLNQIVKNYLLCHFSHSIWFTNFNKISEFSFFPNQVFIFGLRQHFPTSDWKQKWQNYDLSQAQD